MLASSCFTVGRVAGFLQMWCLAFRPNTSLFHQTRASCFSWSESSLGVFWKTPSWLSCAFYWRVASVWPLYHKALIGGVLLEGSPISTEELWSSVRVTIGFLVTSTIAQFGRAACSRTSLGGSKLKSNQIAFVTCYEYNRSRPHSEILSYEPLTNNAV
jgi:hypothetical protein